MLCMQFYSRKQSSVCRRLSWAYHFSKTFFFYLFFKTWNPNCSLHFYLFFISTLILTASTLYVHCRILNLISQTSTKVLLLLCHICWKLSSTLSFPLEAKKSVATRKILFCFLLPFLPSFFFSRMTEEEEEEEDKRPFLLLLLSRSAL